MIKLNDYKTVEYPTTLYKYRDWSNSLHKKILTEGVLYLASPSSFEDVKDCNVPEKFPKKSELYDFFLEKSKKEYPNRNRNEHRQFARYWTEKSPLGNPRKLTKLIEELNNEFNDRFGVLSLTANCNNDTMWEKYANNYMGVCFGFDAKALFDCVGGGGEVQYVDKLPTIDFVKDDFVKKHVKNIFFKEKKWIFEQEYRLHKMWKSRASMDDRCFKFPVDSLVEIRLGKDMPLSDKEEIKQIARQNFPKAKIIECS